MLSVDPSYGHVRRIFARNTLWLGKMFTILGNKGFEYYKSWSLEQGYNDKTLVEFKSKK